MELLQLERPVTSPTKTVRLAEHIEIRELAELLDVKPFRLVADALELKQFKRADDWVDFSTAAAMAQKHGFAVERAD